ncbi:heterodisulfide reductase-related iron-sulfur binding cluster, partial [Cognatilysobacter lacus]
MAAYYADRGGTRPHAPGVGLVDVHAQVEAVIVAHQDRRRAAPPESIGARPVAALFVGCVADTYEASTRASLAVLMDACGIQLQTPAGQGCCGAVHAHSGNASGAAALATRNARAFEGATQVVTLATGCHAAVNDALAPRVP